MILLNHSISAFNAPAGRLPQSDWGLETVFEKQPTETFAAGETVFFEGDPAKDVFAITDGVIRLCKILMDGRRVICGFLFEGDLVGVSQRRRFMYSAEAINTVKMRRITRRSFEEAVERTPKLRPHIFSRMCEEMEAAQKQMVLLSCKNAEERVSSFLVDLMNRRALPGENPILIDLPMTRTDIADYLGMTIETVSRNLTRLAKKGVLTDVGRFTLRIAKPRLLKELAGIWAEEDDDEDWVDDRAMARTAHH